MEIRKLDIETQRAEISIEIQNARIHVKIPDAEMQINREPPRMTIHRESGDVDIDMQEFKSNIGLKNFDELIAYAASKGYAAATEGTRETVNTAAYVGDVTIHGPKVANAAKSKMLEAPDPDPGRSPLPPYVEMEGKSGSFEIEWTKGEVSIEWDIGGLAEVYVEPPCSVEIHLTQRPHVRVSLAEESIPPAAGRNVNTRV